MHRILVAVALSLGIVGSAAAQDDLFLQGNYSASVLNQHKSTTAGDSAGLDLRPTASVKSQSKRQAPVDSGFTVPTHQSEGL